MLSPIVLEGDLSNLGWIRNILETLKGGRERKKSRRLDREGEQMTFQPHYPTPETRCVLACHVLLRIILNCMYWIHEISG